jgi:hypothetical protein
MARTWIRPTVATAISLAHLLWAEIGATQYVEPFRTRNLSPLVSVFGLPSWDAFQTRRSFGVTSELANHYRLSERGGDALILDGETWRNNLFYSQNVTEEWAFNVELPYYQQSGGVLDDVVDAWHSAFGMPDGGRNNRPEEALLYQLANPGGVFYSLDGRARGWGDLQIGVAYKLGALRESVVEATVKLAMGDEDRLAGSGATDWAISLFRPSGRMLGSRNAGYFWGAGVARLGQPDRIDYAAENYGYFGVLGGSLKVLPRFGIKGQFDVHTALYETALEEIGQTSVQVTLGGWWDMSRRAVLEFAINEDLHVSTAPDVVVHASVVWRL